MHFVGPERAEKGARLMGEGRSPEAEVVCRGTTASDAEAEDTFEDSFEAGYLAHPVSAPLHFVGGE